MTDINKKSIFALFAVALMVFSACAVLATCMAPTAADSNDTIELDRPIIVSYSDNKWNITGVTGIPEGKLKLENNTLTIDDLDIVVKNASSDKCYALFIFTYDTNADPQPFTLKFKNANSLTHQPTSTIDFSYGIKIMNVNLTIESEGGLGDALIVKGGDASVFSCGIGCYTGDGSTTKGSFNFVNASVSAKPGYAPKAFGVQSYDDITVKNSSVSTKFISSNSAYGFQCKNLSVLENSSIEVEAAGSKESIGINVSTFKMLGSELTVRTGESDTSIGIKTESKPTEIDHSKVTIDSYTSAVIAANNIEWDTNAFKNMTVKGNKDYQPSGECEPITAATISKDYLILRGEPLTNYTVTFDIDGGTGTTPNPVTVAAGTSFTLPDAKDFKKDGYTFKGWSDGTTKYDARQSYTPTSDVTLKAVWEQNSSGGGDDNTTLIICVVLAIVILVGCGAYAYYKKFKQ